MILNQVDSHKLGEFYIRRDKNSDNWSYLYIFFEDGEEFKRKKEFYSPNYSELIKVDIIEDGTRITEFFKDRVLIKIEKYDAYGILNQIELYIYNKNRELIKVETRDHNKNTLFVESFYRNSDGSLRKLIRSSAEGYYNHWFYKNGIIIEAWLVNDHGTTRTIYDMVGNILEVVTYKDKEILSLEEFSYINSGTLSSSTKSSGSRYEEKKYNRDGHIVEYRVLEDDILLRKTTYVYHEEFLYSETITGHGKREKYIYERKESNDITSLLYYINGALKQIKYIEDENSEIIEYYRDDFIYLKEYFFQGERIKRDLFLDGKLFKSESISE